MAQIITLCPECKGQYEQMFRVKPVVGTTTTEKAVKCEACKKKYRSDILAQYIVSGKRSGK